MGAPDPLWHDMRRLLERMATAADREAVLDECLDTLVEQFGAERALVVQLGQSGLAGVIAGRGPGRDLSPMEREEISRTILRRVAERGECVLWRASEVGTTESMAALAITTAVAAPLAGARGVLYVDFRDVTSEVSEAQLEFFRGAAALVSVVLELSQRLDLAREDLRVARAREDDAPALPPLDELLWPASMAGVRAEVEASLAGEQSVLILGESGTGKTALARALAEASGRKPLVRATLGASDDLNTLSSELFGHERGAFSGAVARRVGLVELAHGGTLVLDEVLNLPRHAQQLLLDFSQFGSYRPLGYEGAQPRRARVRLVAVTNGDLDAAVKDGRFRLDLYYRLAQVVLRVPPLRARRAEIPALAENHLRRLDPARDWTLAWPVRRLLVVEHLPWPGNVRQLEAILGRARARALARDPAATQLLPAHFELADFGVAELPADDGAATRDAAGHDLAGRWRELQGDRGRVEDSERELILAAMRRHGGVVARAARELDIPRTTLVSRLRALGLRPG